MASQSSIKKLNPKLHAIFGILSPSEDAEIRKVLRELDEMILAFAEFHGVKRAGWEGTGFELTWFPSGQIDLGSFVETGNKDKCVSFTASLHPTWYYEDFPTESGWEIEAEIYADCQHKVYCGNMHLVHTIPPARSTHPIDAIKALQNTTAQLIKIGKEKPLEYWLQLAGDNPAIQIR